MLGSTRTTLVPAPTTLGHQEGLHDYPFGERERWTADFAVLHATAAQFLVPAELSSYSSCTALY